MLFYFTYVIVLPSYVNMTLIVHILRRHLHALRNFVGSLVEQAEKSGGCECHKPPSLLLVGVSSTSPTAFLLAFLSRFVTYFNDFQFCSYI